MNQIMTDAMRRVRERFFLNDEHKQMYYMLALLEGIAEKLDTMDNERRTLSAEQGAAP